MGPGSYKNRAFSISSPEVIRGDQAGLNFVCLIWVIVFLLVVFVMFDYLFCVESDVKPQLSRLVFQRDMKITRRCMNTVKLCGCGMMFDRNLTCLTEFHRLHPRNETGLLVHLVYHRVSQFG